MDAHLTDQVAGVAALAEPARRDLYLFISREPAPVSREQAATAVGLPLHTAKFHLERLVDEGLLDVEFRRLTGRTGPGAGRPSKLYRRSSRELAVSLPERRYDLAGEVLASAVEVSAGDGVPLDEAVRTAAGAEGRRLAAAAEQGAVAAEAGDLARAADVLATTGYEPVIAGGEVRLTNCPFDRLVERHTELVCTMNLALIDGVLEGLRLADLRAHLAPEAGFCCVRVGGPLTVSPGEAGEPF